MGRQYYGDGVGDVLCLVRLDTLQDLENETHFVMVIF